MRLLRVMVTGGRTYDTAEAAAHVYRVLDEIYLEEGIEQIIHGACGLDAGREETWSRLNMRGADAMADDWATTRGILCVRYPANWKLHKRAAGPRRNSDMIRMAPDLVVAFPGGAGTATAVALAKQAGIPVRDETGHQQLVGQQVLFRGDLGK